MSKAENRHYTKVWANKFHFAKKCRNAKCTICHPDKVMGLTKHSDKKKIMKHTLTLLGLTAALGANAQCYEYDCSDATLVNIEDGLSNYDGSVCFSGIGTIPTSVNWNSWQVLSFDGEITVNQNINFGSFGTKLISKGNNSFAYFSMDGADSVYVNSGICEVEEIISNNSWDGNWNTIVIDEGAEFYYNGIKIEPDATILTASGTGNKVKVISGCADVPLPIEHDFKASVLQCNNFVLEWDKNISDVVYVERKDTGEWRIQEAINSGYLQGQLDRPTYFRLRINGQYTPIKYLQPCKTMIQIYPNPTFSHVSINSESPIKKVIVSDVMGRKLIETSDSTFTMAHLSTGSYTVMVITETDTKTERITLVD